MSSGGAARAEVVRGWWEYGRLSAGTRAERTWLEQQGANSAPAACWREVQDAVSAGGRPALDLVVALVEAVPPGRDVSEVGAGPLEDLVHEHGADLVGDIERLARTHPGFAEALTAVYLDQTLPDGVRRRIAYCR